MKKNFLIFFACATLVFLPSFVLAAGDPVAVGATADPATNIMCWTRSACTKDWNGDKLPDGMFDSVTDEAQKVCGGGTYGYCYAYQMPTVLSVALPIGGTGATTVQDLGDYINKMYIFLLGISGIIAVLMIMVGGIQYVVSHGSGEVGEAKKRITNALTGLVLLFCANIILYTVNPQLIKLILPQIPKARTVFFVEDGTSCETLLAQNTDPNNPIYELQNNITSGECGDPRPEIVLEMGGAPNPKKYCSWTTCDTTDPVNVCLSNGQGGMDKCMSCVNIFSGNSSNVTPSSETCSRLSAKDVPVSSTDANLKMRQTCFKTNDTSIDLTGTSCALMTLDCSNIFTCQNYAKVSVTSGAASISHDLGVIQKGLGSDLGLQDVCNKDPCKWHRTDSNRNCGFASSGTALVAGAALINPIAGLAVNAMINDVCVPIDPITGVYSPPSAVDAGGY